MSDDPILTYLQSIDARTARMEDAFTAALTDHKKENAVEHDEMRKDLDSLKTSRTAARAGLAALALGGTGGAAKLGFLDKVLGMLGGGGT